MDHLLIFLEAKTDHEILLADMTPDERERHDKRARIQAKTRMAKKLAGQREG